MKKKITLMLTPLLTFSLCLPLFAQNLISSPGIPSSLTPTPILLDSNPHIGKMIISTQAGVISLNGQEINLDYTPLYETDGTLMIPLRLLAEALGYKVCWLPESRTIEIMKDAHTLNLSIHQLTYLINEETTTLEIAPEIKNDKVYVPLALFEKAFGLEIIINDGHI